MKGPTGFESRAGKPLYNLDNVKGRDVEVFCGSWEETVSRVRTRVGERIQQQDVYSLDPLDKRLHIDFIYDPTPKCIAKLLQDALNRGDEGLVLRQHDTWLKVKSMETYDVKVTGILPGKGRNVGRVGALVTPMGNVGTGLTDKLREELTDCVGATVEVECMELTPSGKFRHPRFKRVRIDK